MAKARLGARETAVFAMLGAIMYVSKLLMEWVPNVHLLGLLIVSSTLVYRARALFPIYVYVLLDGLFSGFAAWWLPYVYIWAALWGAAMLIPRNLPKKFLVPLCMVVPAIHGFAFGTLYAPAQALLYGYSLKQAMAWIAAGFYFDLIHGISNFFMGILAAPLADLIKRVDKGWEKRP
jgi:energy-coupling factor transport system substrate-specific component